MSDDERMKRFKSQRNNALIAAALLLFVTALTTGGNLPAIGIFTGGFALYQLAVAAIIESRRVLAANDL